MLANVKLFGPMSRAVGQTEVPVPLECASLTCAALRAEIFAPSCGWPASWMVVASPSTGSLPPRISHSPRVMKSH